MSVRVLALAPLTEFKYYSVKRSANGTELATYIQQRQQYGHQLPHIVTYRICVCILIQEGYIASMIRRKTVHQYTA